MSTGLRTIRVSNMNVLNVLAAYNGLKYLNIEQLNRSFENNLITNIAPAYTIQLQLHARTNTKRNRKCPTVFTFHHRFRFSKILQT